ncbi:hypothetical protein [Neptunicella marina]|uniref:Uncharacterized protein n=1 Tax=Neptunicella marina TaxID=2125989 RepID=A0A8J6M6J8_9ALTE|nr:hypothetical protein [Neptunicella marina]MBC3767181.1 hypothetical protein [Neptunicella marina]
MTSKIMITFGVLVYAVLIPFLEINASHVFNDTWLPHARLHEVWQLTTNSAIGLFALWLTWRKGEIRVASILNIAVMGGVLVAHALSDSYGGSIMSGNIEKNVLGIELAAFAAGVVVIMAGVAFFLANRLSQEVRF